MTRTRLVLLVALAASFAVEAAAQGTKMTVRPESKVTLAGRSNVHDWSCKSSDFQATIELDSTYQILPLTSVAKPISKVAVTIPVKSLKCGHGKMDENMYKALKATEFPEIRYVLESYDVNSELTTATTFIAASVGQLTVAGKTQRAEISITAERKDGGSMIGEGSLKILMTDFGIKPPVALLGTLRTKNEIQVSFKVLLDRSTVVALSQE